MNQPKPERRWYRTEGGHRWHLVPRKLVKHIPPQWVPAYFWAYCGLMVDTNTATEQSVKGRRDLCKTCVRLAK